MLLATLPVLRRMQRRFVSSSVSERDLSLAKGVDRRREDGEGVEMKIDTSPWTDLCRVFPAIEFAIFRTCVCTFFTKVFLLGNASNCYDVDRLVCFIAVARNTWN